MNKRIFVFLILLLVVSFSTQAFAALTFTSDAITGTTASTIDLGVGNNLFLQTSGGKVGVGTTAPVYTLSVVHPNTDSALGIDFFSASTPISIRRANGTPTAPTKTLIGDTLGGLSIFGHTGSAYFGGPAARILAVATQDGDIGRGTDLHFSTASNGGILGTRMVLNNIGNLGIGTTTPGASSILDISSTTKGVVLPRMTKVQRDAIVIPVAGMVVYQTDNTPGLRVYNGTNWMRFTETAD